MTKDLHKAIMKRSRLRNKFLRDKTDISREEHKKQRNLCVSLLKKAKKDHFANLDIKSVTYSKNKTKTNPNNNILLWENIQTNKTRT